MSWRLGFNEHHAHTRQTVRCLFFVLHSEADSAFFVSAQDKLDAFNVCLHGKHPACSATLIKAFPQLLARVVHIGAIQLYDLDVVCLTLRKYTASGVAALKVATAPTARFLSFGAGCSRRPRVLRGSVCPVLPCALLFFSLSLIRAVPLCGSPGCLPYLRRF